MSLARVPFLYISINININTHDGECVKGQTTRIPDALAVQ
jgi:uncharacterized Fe-S cluster protein YjdI